MANDALDPGPNGDYPYWPRKADGSTDRERMPRGIRKRRRKLEDRSPFGEEFIVYDVTPRKPDGSELDPGAV